MDNDPGWKRLLDGWPWFTGSGQYAISAYSEHMPPPRIGRRAYGSDDLLLFRPDDPWGWHINEYEQGFELSPGLSAITRGTGPHRCRLLYLFKLKVLKRDRFGR